MNIPELPRPIDAPAQPKRLYSLGSIDVATFLGSCFAGSLIVAANLRAMRNIRAAIGSAILGFLGLIALLGALSLIDVPESKESLVAFLAQGIQVAIVHFFAARLFGDQLAEHEEAGGRFYSTWRAAAMSLAVIALPFAAYVYSVSGAYSENLGDLKKIRTEIFAPSQVRLADEFYLEFKIENGGDQLHILDSIRAPTTLVELPPRRQSDPAHSGFSIQSESSTCTFRFGLEIPSQANLSVLLPARASQTGTLWSPISVCFDGPETCLDYRVNLPVVP